LQNEKKKKNHENSHFGFLVSGFSITVYTS